MAKKKNLPRKSSAPARIPPKLRAIIRRGDQAYDSYRHEEAVQAYSEALSWKPANELPDEERFRLLSQRAETYRALGDFPATLADRTNLEPVARRTKRTDLLVEAAFLKEEIRTYSAQGGGGMKLAKDALKLARAAKDTQLEAKALTALGMAYRSADDLSTAEQCFQQALSLFKGPQERRAHAICLIFLARIPGPQQAERALALGMEALDIARLAGDRRLESQVLVMTSIFYKDAAAKRRLAESALSIAQELDLGEVIGVSLNFLSLIYIHLGLYETALRYIRQSIEMGRRGAHDELVAASLETEARVAWALGDLEGAEKAFEESLALGRGLQNRSFVAYNVLGLGRLARLKGDHALAIQQIESAIQEFGDLGELPELAYAQASLAEVELSRGKWQEALKTVRQAADTAKSAKDVNLDFPPQAIWWTYHQVLKAHPKNRKYLDTKDHSKGTLDDEAVRALDRAFELAKSNVAEVTDTGLKRSYWNKVEINRSILLEMARTRPEEVTRLFGEDTEQGGIGGQLERMLDIGVRMNELRDPDELVEFVMAQLIELSGAEDAALILEEEESGRICRAQRGFLSGADPVAAAGPFLDECSRTARAVLRQDVADFDPAKQAKGRFDRLSVLVVPLASHGQLKGYLYAANHTLFGPFSQEDLNLISAFSNQVAAALDNAILNRDLERRVAERTEALSNANTALQDRAAELSIINSIQRALASELDMASIYETVGEQLRSIFEFQVIVIYTADLAKRQMAIAYGFEKGQRIEPMVVPFNSLYEDLVHRGGTFVFNGDFPEYAAQFDDYKVPGGELPKSLLGVPIRRASDSSTIDLIGLQDIDGERVFTEADVRLLETLANSMGVALENARLLEETEERAAELSIINSVQQGLASKLDMQAIYDLVGNRIRDIFDAQVVHIRIYNPKTDIVSFPFVLDRDERLEVSPIKVNGLGITGEIIQMRKPLLINRGVRAHSEALGTGLLEGQKEWPKSTLGCPIMVGDDVSGIVLVENFDREDVFNQNDVNLLTTLASSMSVALENARLFDETNRLLEETRQRAAELAIINNVGQALVKKLEFDAILELVGQRLRDLFEADTAYIMLYDPETRWSHTAYYIDRGERIQLQPGTLSAGLNVRIVDSKEPLRLGTAEESVQLGAVRIASDGAQDLNESFLGVPFFNGDKVAGVISVQSYQQHAYDEEDVRLLSTLASSMSVALENARLFEETNRLLDETRQRNAELAVINKVQEGLASKLDLAGIVEVVGDEIAQILQTENVSIGLLVDDGQTIITPYLLEEGRRIPVDPLPLDQAVYWRQAIETRRPVLPDYETAKKRTEEWGGIGDPDMPFPKTSMFVPILSGDEGMGVISVFDKDTANAYDESDVNLVSTLANSMSVALENARLFEETNRLLDETRQRNAELAVINSIQDGLASKLDIQGIFDLVGDKIQEIFDAQVVAISIYDQATKTEIWPYIIERGERLQVEPGPTYGFSAQIFQTLEPLMINEGMDEKSLEFGADVMAGEPVKSFLGVPLVVGGQAKGVINLQNIDHEDAFDEADQRLLSTIASSMSVALENARLFEETTHLLDETRQRNAELAVINSIQEGLASKLDIQGIFDLVGDKIQEIFDAQVVAITTYDKDTGLESYPYIIERGKRLHAEPREVYGFTAHILKTLKPLMVNENLDEVSKQYGADVVVGEEVKSYLGVPLVVGTEAKGELSLQNIDHENAFTESDQRLLTTIASSMSVALENARLFEETSRLLEETRQRAEELSLINDVGTALSKKLEYDAILELVGERVRQIFQADTMYILLYDADTELANMAYYVDRGKRHEKDIDEGKPGPTSGLSKIIIDSGEPLLLGTREASDELGSVRIAKPGEEDLNQSFLGVPFFRGDHVGGVISVQSYQKHRYDKSDIRLLMTLATSMSVSLENARLFEETTRLLEQSRQRNTELAAVNTVSQALVAETEIDNLIQLIGDQVRKTFHADIAYVALFDPKTDMVNFPYLFGEELSPMRYGEGLTGQILQSGEPLLLNRDIDEAMAEMHTERVGVAAASYLGVPIVVGSKAIGVISVQSTREEGRFGETDVSLLSTIAANAGAAIRNAQLLAETKRRAAEMAALNEIGREASASLDLPTVLDRITERARTMLQAETSAVILLDEDGHTLRPIAASGLGHEEVMVFSWQWGEGLIGDIVKKGRAERISDAASDPRSVHIEGTEPSRANEKVMVAPLFAREEVIGAMVVWRGPDDEMFNEDNLSLLTGLSQQAGASIQNARWFAEVQRQKQYMEAVVENSPVAIVTVDGDFRVVSWNPAAERLFGYTAEEAIGQDAHDLHSKDESILAESRSYSQQIADGERVQAITQRTRKDGQLVDVEVMGVPVLVDGDQVGNIIIYHDISDLKRTEAALLEQKQYLEDVVGNSPVAIVTTDQQARVVSWNPAAETLFGYAADEAIGKDIDRLITGRDREMQNQARVFSQMALEGRLHETTQRTRKDGSLVDVELLGVPVKVDGEQAGIIAIYHDITELKRATEEAQSANEAKSAFLATMSHEIRTPMNAVIGMSGLLLDTELTSEQREFAEIIRNSSDSLLAIINDILDFSKIEAGKMELENQPFGLRECIEGTLDLVAGRAFEKELDLAYFIEDGTPTRIIGDVTRFRQILLNLLTNAVKFTDTGEVVVTVSADEQGEPGGNGSGLDADRHVIRVRVRDTGIGIPPDRMDRLFQSFSQVDASTARKYGGTGLGLAISKRLAEMMGGTMSAESKVGEGTVFEFTVQALEAEDATATSLSPEKMDPQLRGRRVLVVDDNDTNRRILGLQVKGWGMAPRDTHSPRQALEWIRSGEPFDVAILDMHMPEMDGLSLAREIRQLRGAASLPMILFTSLGRREVGADDIEFAAYLTKPIKPSQLLDALTAVLADRPAQAQVPSIEAPRIDPELANHHPLRILLAEDNAVNQKLAIRLLQQMGYRADVAANGLEVLESLGRQTYDVVLMDVQMPEMDGLEASREINRRWEQSDRPRIVAMTANAMQGDRERCIEAGMDDYISKPVRVHELVDALRRVPARAE